MQKGVSHKNMACVFFCLERKWGAYGTVFWNSWICRRKRATVFERDKNNRRVLARRSYNLYSDVQKGENVVVEIPVQAGEKHFKYEQKVKLVNPRLYGRGYAIGDMGHTDYVLVADDIVVVEEK